MKIKKLKVIAWCLALAIGLASWVAAFFIFKDAIPMDLGLVHLAWILFWSGFGVMLIVCLFGAAMQSIEAYKIARKNYCKYGRVLVGAVLIA